MYLPFYSDLFEADENLPDKYYQLSKNACQKLNIEGKIKYLDKGVYGFAFRVGKDKVFKFTKDISEVAVALRNTNTQKYIVNIFDVKRVKTDLVDDKNLFLIVEDYVRKIPRNKIEYIAYLITQIHKNNLSDIDRFLNENEMLLKNNKSDKNLEKYLSDFKNIYHECKKLKISKLDLHIDNIGIGIEKNLVLFDLGNLEDEKLSENIDMIKI